MAVGGAAIKGVLQLVTPLGQVPSFSPSCPTSTAGPTIYFDSCLQNKFTAPSRLILQEWILATTKLAITP